MNRMGTDNTKLILPIMAFIYFLVIASILIFGESCHVFSRAEYCSNPCEHGCETAFGVLQYGKIVDFENPDQAFTDWPPGYGFFILPFFWAGDGDSLLWAVIAQAALFFAAGLSLRRAIDDHVPGYGMLMMGLYIFNPNLIGLALMPKTDSIFAIFLTMSFVFLLYYIRGNKVWQVALAGVLVGGAVLIRPSAQFLVVLLPFIIVLMAWINPESRRISRALLHGLTGAALGTAVVFPWAMHVNNQGQGYRIASPATEYIFLSDNIGAMEAHLAGLPMSQRMVREFAAKLNLQLSQSTPNWSELDEAEKISLRVSAARRHLISYSPSDYLFPVARSITRFFVTGGEGYLLRHFGLDTTSASVEAKWFEGGAPFKVLVIKIIAKGYAVVLRLLGLVGLYWLVRQGRYPVLALCLAPVLYFMALHLFEGWSRFRLPVEAPLALLAVAGVAALRDWRQLIPFRGRRS